MIHYAIALAIVALDQATKWYMSELLPLCRPGRCESIEILPVFNFTLLHNEGAAFSFLAGAGGWQRWFLVGVSTTAGTVLVVWLYRLIRRADPGERILALALAFVLGGAVGNLVDRALQGYVVDFVVVHYGSYYFPAFNVADSAITVGAGLLLLDMFYKPGEKTLAS